MTKMEIEIRTFAMACREAPWQNGRFSKDPLKKNPDIRDAWRWEGGPFSR